MHYTTEMDMLELTFFVFLIDHVFRHRGAETRSSFLRLTYDLYLAVCICWSVSLVIIGLMHEICNTKILRGSFAHLLPCFE
jgi:hypothetical protein